MQLNEPLRWTASGEGVQTFETMVRRGGAVEVSHRAPKWLAGSPVAVETSVYDRYVCWDGQATRNHCVHLDEGDRMSTLLESCCYAAIGNGGCFVCKAIDADGGDLRTRSRVLTITNYGQASRPAWLIHE